MDDIESTLIERGGKYGPFKGHALIAQALKDMLRCFDGWGRLALDQKEALDMIAHKIGRIINGDPDYADSWHDIAGYAELIVKRLEQKPL